MNCEVGQLSPGSEIFKHLLNKDKCSGALNQQPAQLTVSLLSNQQASPQKALSGPGLAVQAESRRCHCFSLRAHKTILA